MYSLSAEGGCSHTVNWKEEKVCVGGVGVRISKVCDYRVPTD